MRFNIAVSSAMVYAYEHEFITRLIKKGFRPINSESAEKLKKARIKVTMELTDVLAMNNAQSTQSSPSLLSISNFRSQVVKHQIPQTSDDPIKRGFALLELSDFEQAEKLFEQALDLNPKLSSAYIGILMAEQKVRNTSELVSSSILLENDELFQEAMKCASPKMKQTLDKYVQLNRAKFNGGR